MSTAALTPVDGKSAKRPRHLFDGLFLGYGAAIQRKGKNNDGLA